MRAGVDMTPSGRYRAVLITKGEVAARGVSLYDDEETAQAAARRLLAGRGFEKSWKCWSVGFVTGAGVGFLIWGLAQSIW